MRSPFTGELIESVRVVPDFPEPGIAFQDLAPLYAAPGGLRRLGEQLAAGLDTGFDRVLGIEARGFVIGAAVATVSDRPLQLARKAGKLPGPLHVAGYALEYGTDVLTIQQDEVTQGERVLVVDDVLATGGTLAAAGALVEQAGASVAAFAVILELTALGGAARLAPQRLVSLIEVA
jgi:adenine phosphoribosyltransferase